MCGRQAGWEWVRRGSPGETPCPPYTRHSLPSGSQQAERQGPGAWPLTQPGREGRAGPRSPSPARGHRASQTRWPRPSDSLPLHASCFPFPPCWNKNHSGRNVLENREKSPQTCSWRPTPRRPTAGTAHAPARWCSTRTHVHCPRGPGGALFVSESPRTPGLLPGPWKHHTVPPARKSAGRSVSDVSLLKQDCDRPVCFNWCLGHLGSVLGADA